MAGLCAPLSTLRQHPRRCRRMTRGQCGSLDLHCERLALSTPCRSSRRTAFLVYMLPPLPRCSGWAYSSLISPSRLSLPRKGHRVGLHIVLFEACSAFTRVAACTLARSPIRDPLSEGFRHFVSSMPAPVASGGSESPGGPCTHWKAPPCHGAHPLRTLDLSTMTGYAFYHSGEQRSPNCLTGRIAIYGINDPIRISTKQLV